MTSPNSEHRLMNGVRALVVICLNVLPVMAQAGDQSRDDELRDTGIEQLASIACDPTTLGKKILEGKTGVVPEKIYHFGKKENLLNT